MNKSDLYCTMKPDLTADADGEDAAVSLAFGKQLGLALGVSRAPQMKFPEAFYPSLPPE